MFFSYFIYFKVYIWSLFIVIILLYLFILNERLVWYIVYNKNILIKFKNIYLYIN